MKTKYIILPDSYYWNPASYRHVNAGSQAVGVHSQERYETFTSIK